MKTTINCLALFIMLFLRIPAYSQNFHPSEIKIHGNIKDSLKRIENRILASYYYNDGFHTAEGTNIWTKIDSLGNFSFSLPDLHRPYMLYLRLYDTKEGTPAIWKGDYFAESGDDIEMKLVLRSKNNSLIFSGIGAGKYIVVDSLSTIRSSLYSDRTFPNTKIVFKDSIEATTKLTEMYDFLKKYDDKAGNAIKKTNLNTDMRSIVKCEFAPYDAEWAWRTHLFLNSNPNFKNLIANTYFKLKPQFHITLPELSVVCPLYMMALSSSINAFEKVLKGKSNFLDVSDFYSDIKRNYSGILKDRLIAECFFDKTTNSYFQPYQPVFYDSLLIDAYKTISDKYLKKQFEDKLYDYKKTNLGAKVIDATFFQLDGKEFKLNALKGNVYLIDTWFNGCTFCAQFHEIFEKKIRPQFKDNRNFKILSLNIDKTEEMWHKGIEKKIYTSGDYINVNTGKGEGLENSFLKYYKVPGAPFLMLVDADGSILLQPNGTSIEELTICITAALNRISK
jgi:hypothetical protein